MNFCYFGHRYYTAVPCVLITDEDEDDDYDNDDDDDDVQSAILYKELYRNIKTNNVIKIFYT